MQSTAGHVKLDPIIHQLLAPAYPGNSAYALCTIGISLNIQNPVTIEYFRVWVKNQKIVGDKENLIQHHIMEMTWKFPPYWLVFIKYNYLQLSEEGESSTVLAEVGQSYATLPTFQARSIQ